MKTRLVIAAIVALTVYVSTTIASGQTITIESQTAVLLPDSPGQLVNTPQ